MNAKVVVPVMQVGGLGMMLYGWQVPNPPIALFGVAIAVVGGVIWKIAAAS